MLEVHQIGINSREDMILNTIGEKIREFRKTYNLSQRELCDGICTNSQLSLIENNKIKAKPEMI